MHYVRVESQPFKEISQAGVLVYHLCNSIYLELYVDVHGRSIDMIYTNSRLFSRSGRYICECLLYPKRSILAVVPCAKGITQDHHTFVTLHIHLVDYTIDILPLKALSRELCAVRIQAFELL